MTRSVHLTPRTEAALELLGTGETAADIGCDHGRLTAALLQRNRFAHVVATDISPDSLEKARSLLGYIGIEDRVSFRAGDGLSVLADGECDALAVLGMGGTLMARMFDAAGTPLAGARSAVLQPMRAQADIRAYLWKHCFRITDERIVREGDRLYELLRVVPDTVRQALPAGWPDGFFELGFVAWEQRDPLFWTLWERHAEQLAKRMQEAKGTAGEERIAMRMRALETIRTL